MQTQTLMHDQHHKKLILGFHECICHQAPVVHNHQHKENKRLSYQAVLGQMQPKEHFVCALDRYDEFYL